MYIKQKIYEGISLPHAFTSAPLGSKAVFENLERKLRDWGVERNLYTGKISPFISEVTESELERITTSMCFVTHSRQEKMLDPSPWPAHSSTKLKSVETKESHAPIEIDTPEVNAEWDPSKPTSQFPLKNGQILHFDKRVRSQAAEVLFEGDEENVSVATLILESLLKVFIPSTQPQCPHDTRCELLRSLVVVGGTSMLPGFKVRLGNELLHLMKSSEYVEFAELQRNNIRYLSLPSPPNYLGWVGASIVGSVDSVFNSHLIIAPPKEVKPKTVITHLNLSNE